MRDYGRIRSRFWGDEEIVALTGGPKLLACYLMTCAHGNAIGCFRLPLGYIAEDLRAMPSQVAVDMVVLEDIGFVLRDPATGWVLIPNHLKHNPIENPKVGIACARLLDAVPDAFPFLADLLKAIEPFAEKLSDTVLPGLRQRIAKVSDRTAEGRRNNNLNPKPDPNPKPSDAIASSAADAPPAQLPLIDPKRIIFGECLDWLAKAQGKPPEKLRGLLGRMCRDYGDANVIKAFQTASRDPPAGDPIEFLVAILQTSGGQRGRSGQGKAGFGNAFMAAESRHREASDA